MARLTEITNCLEDDWDDNKLTSRDSPSEGYFLHPSDGLLSGDMEAGDALKGVYRPDWTTDSGSPSATNQELKIPDGSSTIQALETPSVFAIGEWAFDFTKQSAGSTNRIRLYFFAKQDHVPSDAYSIKISVGGNYILERRLSGTNSDIISSSWNNDTNQHTAKSTRDSYGGFELFLDGVSKGTASNTEITEANYSVFRNGADTEWRIDNLKVI